MFLFISFLIYIQFISSLLIKEQYNTLYSFYNSTNGPNWFTNCNSKWKFQENSDPCINKWQGITCLPSTCLITSPCYITSISLGSCNLKGILPSNLGYIRTLNTLNLPSNLIQGTLPYSFNNITRLQWLDLSSNSFHGSLPNISKSILSFALRRNYLTGSIPERYSTLSSLISFDVRYNQLSGTLSPNFLRLSSTVSFELSSNKFTGTFPGFMLSKVQILQLENNLLNGTIPIICSYPSCLLGTFTLANNNISGTIPSEIFGPLKSLTTFNISYNLLTGTIPSTIGCITRISVIDLSNNLLAGTVNNIFKSKSLRTLDLSNNQFNGPINFTFSATQLTQLNLYNNFFSGPIQLGKKFQYLTILDLASNYFSSTLPTTFGYLSAIQQLHLSNNLFTSSIPLQLSTRPYLRLVDLSYNYLTGTIPPQFFNSSTTYKSLSIILNLYLHGNYFSGIIPPTICRAPVLRQVSLFNNFLTGTIPPLQNCASIQTILLQNNKLIGDPGKAFEISIDTTLKYTNFSLLQAIDLSDNYFSSTIPKQIFQLPRILYVAIVGGCYHGEIPEVICNATTLSTLVLEGLRSGKNCREHFLDPFNAIPSKVYRTSTVTGKIPSCIWNLTNLETLYLSGNLIEGTIPSSDIIPSSLKRLSLSYNKLTGTIPISLQTQEYQYFDLEHNRLTGTSENIIINKKKKNETHLTLSVNRLSGHINNLKYLESIDVLSGNIYSCRDRSDLPENDPEATTYLCASDALDLSLLFWFLITILFFIILIISIYTVQYRRRISSSFSESESIFRPSGNLSYLFNQSFLPTIRNNSINPTISQDPDIILTENPLNRTSNNSISSNDGRGTVLEKVSDTIHLIFEYYDEIKMVDKNLNPELCKFLKTISYLRLFTIKVTIFSSTIILGFYLLMKLNYNAGTHE